MVDAPSTTHVAALLAQAGVLREFQLESLPGGGNNRVYRINSGSSSYLLKAYFHHADDQRDRLGTEFAFTRFAWEHGLRCVAQPLACDHANHLGLYEFIHGRALQEAEINQAAVDQAIGFFIGLNRNQSASAAQSLPNGSEACFTLEEHLACVERRTLRLSQIEVASAIDEEAAAWIESKLMPAWKRARNRVVQESANGGLAMSAELATGDRCLSPSDFGFHNAIVAAGGELRFVDFEYAGWDDPAKTVCDFLCQPKLPLPDELAGYFTQAVIAGLSDSAFHQRRISLLLPVYRLKWCCIMLNEFLPVGSQRRSFAQAEIQQLQRKQSQLEKADRALQRVEN